MNSSFTNPQRVLTREEREALLRTLLPDTVCPSRPLVSPPDPVPSVKDFLRLDTNNLMTDAGQQQGDNFVQAAPRPPDHKKEIEALKFTFGNTVGEYLIGVIRIVKEGEENDGNTLVIVDEDYDPANLGSLVLLIYKATRVWQQETGRHKGKQGRINYNYTQLYGLELDRLNTWQHAGAVQDWFYVNYGIETGMVSHDETRAIFERLWKRMFKILKLDPGYRPYFGDDPRGGQDRTLQQTVNNHYGCVIEEIRNPELLPESGG